MHASIDARSSINTQGLRHGIQVLVCTQKLEFHNLSSNFGQRAWLCYFSILFLQHLGEKMHYHTMGSKRNHIPKYPSYKKKKKKIKKVSDRILHILTVCIFKIKPWLLKLVDTSNNMRCLWHRSLLSCRNHLLGMMFLIQNSDLKQEFCQPPSHRDEIVVPTGMKSIKHMNSK